MTDTTPLTQGSLRDLFACEELWRLRRLALLRPRDKTSALVTGSAFHHGIEHRSPGLGADHLLSERGADMLEGEERLAVELEAVEVIAMVKAALNKWGDDWPSRQEVEFALPLRNPATGRAARSHTFHGVIDGFPDDPIMGSQWVDTIGEWKTASRPTSAYFDRLRIDWQISAYCEAASLMTGRKVRRVRYRVITKPGIKPSRGETDAEYAKRTKSRAPLASLKPRSLKTMPKGVSSEDGFFSHNGAEYTRGTLDGVACYVERDSSVKAREKLREAARAPLKRRQADTPASYLARCLKWYDAHPEAVTEELVLRDEQQMERWRAEAWALHLRALDIEQAHRASEQGRHVERLPIRNPSRCVQYGRRCDFLDLCSGLVGPEAYEVIDNPHPELDGVPPTALRG